MSEIVKFNVGGIRYETTKSTLMNDPESMLAKMIEQPNEMKKIENGEELFIDRDGEYFRHVLNYLRNGALTALPFDTRLLTQEANFYQLSGLIDLARRDPRFKIGDAVQLNDKPAYDYFQLLVEVRWYPGPQGPIRCCWACSQKIQRAIQLVQWSPPDKINYEYLVGKIFEIVGHCAIVGFTDSCLHNACFPGTRFDKNDTIFKIHIPFGFLKKW